MTVRIAAPTYEAERQIAAACAASSDEPVIVVGVDEVGRGALAGPVAVGACAVAVHGGEVALPLPDGIADSKLLSARRREGLAGPVRESAHACAVGWAAPSEIDASGIVAALSLAAARAIGDLGVPVHAVLMDGNADVITPALRGRVDPLPQVCLRVKADRDCASVAAASIIAKVARDEFMVELARDAPQYEWARNKGYGSAAHRAAIATYGTHEAHRRSWNLFGATQDELPGVLWDPVSAAERPGRQEERQR